MREQILFVCTGNTCRSPMAEALLNHFGKGEIVARSAGLFANSGQSANPNAVKALDEMGVKIDHHSQAVSSDLVNWSTIILTMTQHHKQALILDYPDAVDKTFTFKEYVYDQLEHAPFWKNWQEAISDREEARLVVDQIQKQQTATEKEKKEALERLQEAEARVKTMEEDLPNYDIHDPFGSDLEQYRAVCRELTELVNKWIGKLN